MFTLVSGDIDQTDPDLADRIYRFRHRFFVEGLGWDACRRPDGRERDQFDGPATFHLVSEHEHEIVAYARFLPTTGPHLLSHLYPEILQGAAAPRGRRVYEWTRQAITAKRREMSDAQAFTIAFSGAVALTVDVLGLEGLLIQFHPAHITRLLDTGWEVEPLTLPILYQGNQIVPVYARVTERTLTAARAAFAALNGAALQIPRAFQLAEPASDPTVILR
ncbi:acyl-homoserine-lactone synthase [Methylobacterium brachiatum]|uniref:acyl-homoserine-lactone synthase n=1 Tax=Methylobacterium brachiatum TaxID=269660 RepID=UPI00244B243D|nr:acyl-homoserine-lactone synthase [Methylobacterium brachiatum]MDH2310315.1 acyl-homoserine-lactone synthase [Methylobacterium brachiatum]